MLYTCIGLLAAVFVGYGSAVVLYSFAHILVK